MQFWMYKNTCVYFAGDPLRCSPPFWPNSSRRQNIGTKGLGTIKNGWWNDPRIFIQTFMLNLGKMVNLQFQFSLVVKVLPVKSLNTQGSTSLSRISSKFHVRISAGWWKNDDKGINPKVNLNIYNTWALLMLRWCPWCRTSTNLFRLVVHETKKNDKKGPIQMNLFN